MRFYFSIFEGWEFQSEYILPKRDAELERLMAPKFEPLELIQADPLDLLEEGLRQIFELPVGETKELPSG